MMTLLAKKRMVEDLGHFRPKHFDIPKMKPPKMSEQINQIALEKNTQ